MVTQTHEPQNAADKPRAGHGVKARAPEALRETTRTEYVEARSGHAAPARFFFPLTAFQNRFEVADKKMLACRGTGVGQDADGRRGRARLGNKTQPGTRPGPGNSSTSSVPTPTSRGWLREPREVKRRQTHPETRSLTKCCRPQDEPQTTSQNKHSFSPRYEGLRNIS